jgi:hypothetical protein
VLPATAALGRSYPARQGPPDPTCPARRWIDPLGRCRRRRCCRTRWRRMQSTTRRPRFDVCSTYVRARYTRGAHVARSFDACTRGQQLPPCSPNHRVHQRSEISRRLLLFSAAEIQSLPRRCRVNVNRRRLQAGDLGTRVGLPGPASLPSGNKCRCHPGCRADMSHSCLRPRPYTHRRCRSRTSL